MSYRPFASRMISHISQHAGMKSTFSNFGNLIGWMTPGSMRFHSPGGIVSSDISRTVGITS
ncbi:MAG TPA: hypothetical protein VGP89_17875 [Candidatus Angelobacter sp.]|nr:hypothetical protein [Candidatus Angelobacter sp.]